MSTDTDSSFSPADLVQSTFEAISDAIFVVALPERTIAHCNAAAAEMFGYERDELVGSNTERIHVDATNWEQFHEESIEPLEEQGYFRGEFEMKRADETTFPTEHMISFVHRDEDGEPTHSVSVVRDISKRKRAERQLRKSEETFVTAFRMNPTPQAITTLEEGRFQDVNEAFCELAGLAHGELAGARITEVDLAVGDSDVTALDERIASGDELRDVETTLRRPDGDLRHVRWSSREIEVDETPCLLSVVQDVTVQKHYERELQNRALEDGLTGLPNRTLFRDRLEYALERSEQSDGSVAVAFLDLDRFQVVNKTLGHAAGDTLLKQVANRLTREVEDLVTVARFGADEFALLFEGVETSADAESRCRDLVDAVTEPLEIADTVIHPEISAGVAIGAPDDCPGDVLRYAEAALSNVERSDRVSVDCYHRERDSADARELHREHALRRAVEEREFAVRYQPVVDLATGEPVGAEVLVRWDHPEHGILSPAEFLDVAEETGMIVPIGYQVLERATADVVDWLDERPGGREDDLFRLAVNLSPTQYRAPDVVDRIREIADDSELPLDRLVLEITENILVTSNGKLASLRDDDVRVAIDDFGTGYASLQYLRQLDADELKIDRSFLRGLESGSREYTLVEAILGIGRSCDLAVIAEGIETDEQRRLLVEMGATLGQGYFFARPMSAGEFASRYLAEPS